MYMLALAFADNAFENDFTGPEDIYKLIVLPKTDCICLQWKDSWAETPVFCDVEKTASGICVSQRKSIQYHKHKQFFIYLS
jgi:hypothetical protein